MKKSPQKMFSALAAAAISFTFAATVSAQSVINPVPNRIISWNLDDWSTVNPTDLAGLAPATNWVDTYLNNITTSLPDNTGAATTMNLYYSSYNTYQVYGYHVGYDANGTANREMLNGFLNAGPAAWNPPVTNTYVALTNIPYAQYDVVVYFNSDTSGRHASIDNGSTTYYFSTMGSAAVSGVNALFQPATQTNSAIFPGADFAFFPGMTNADTVITETPKSGNDQWLGIAGFQVIQSSNVYVLYGPSPVTQIVPVGQPASFSVMAGGLNPKYQWRHAGVGIANATNAAYTIAATAPGQDGNYDVIISNSFSSVTSVVATLTFYAPKTLEWAGTGSTWDTTSLFWKIAGSGAVTNYTETDNVRFGPLGAAQPNVSLAATFTPTSLTVSNGTYLLLSGSLNGTGSLHLQNNATLILDTVDTRTGPTLIDAGSVYQLDNGDTAGSLGSGALTNNGALLFDAAGDEAYGYPVYGAGSITNLGSSGTITLGNTLNANYLVQAGGGSLLLQGNNNLTGGLVVSSGYVLARASGCLGQGTTVLNGGELQLIFNIDFAGSALSLAGGLLHGGISGSGIYEGQVSLATDSSIAVDGGNSLTLANVAGINGDSYNLTTTGSGTLILTGTNNSWASVTLGAGTLQIGNGGTAGGLGSGTISGAGNLVFDLAGNLVVTNPVTGLAAVNQNGTGVVTLTADNSAAGFSGNINVNSGTLLLNGTSGYGVITVSTNATFGGSGYSDAEVDINPGGTLAPGAAGSVAKLTINNNLTIGGNLAIDLNKSLAQSNDFVYVSSTLSNTNNGVVTVNNLGPALVAGDSFQLFNQPVTGGDALTIASAGGIVWSNKLSVNGTIVVLSTTLPHPVITAVVVLAGSANLVLSGTNGVANGTYHVLSATNLTQASWSVEAAGTFDASGHFSATNSITAGHPQKFYRLQVP